jgi:hypothetical protein
MSFARLDAWLDVSRRVNSGVRLLPFRILEVMKTKHHIGIMLIYISVASPTFAQQKNHLEPVFGTTNNCEDAKARLDATTIEVGKEGFIILITRLGDGESLRKVNRQRLYYILRYFNRADQLGEKRLITAEGERIRGLGRVEIYAKGKLMLILTTKRNGDILGVKSCGLE